jgi:hypothetical protein
MVQYWPLLDWLAPDHTIERKHHLLGYGLQNRQAA